MCSGLTGYRLLFPLFQFSILRMSTGEQLS